MQFLLPAHVAYVWYFFIMYTDATLQSPHVKLNRTTVGISNDLLHIFVKLCGWTHELAKRNAIVSDWGEKTVSFMT